LRDDGLHYAELLEGAGNTVEVVRLDGAFHGFMTLPVLQSYAVGVDEVSRFLTSTLA
jgi:acetyl esterase